MARYSVDQYDWASCTITLLNKELVGARGFTVTVEQEKEQIYGAGNEALAIGKGNKTVSGELVLLQSEFEALNEAAAGNILDLRSLQIIFAYESESGEFFTNTVWGAEFTNYDKSLANNDKMMEITIPFVALDFQEKGA